TSNNYQLKVDIYKPLREKSDEELGFTITRLAKKFNGCKISGYIYTNITDSMGSITEIIEEIQSIIKYVQIPVFINKNQINKNISDCLDSECKIIEDDYAYYILDPNSDSLKVYNIGVWVPYARFKNAIFKGSIISKSQFKITSSRNEIIEDRCELFKNIEGKIRDVVDPTFIKLTTINEKKNKKLSSKLALGMLANILKNPLKDCRYDKEAILMMLNTPLDVFTDYKGYKQSLIDISKSKAIMMVIRSDYDVLVVEKIEKRTNCLILEETYDISHLQGYLRTRLIQEYIDKNEQPDNENLYDYDYMLMKLLSEFKDIVVAYTNYEMFTDIPPVTLLNYKDEKEKISFDRKIIDQKDLNNEQTGFLEFLKKLNTRFCDAYPDFINDCYGKREIFLGKSELDNAWTNMTSNIVFDIRTISFYQQNSYLRLLLILIHEYAHLLDDEEGHNFEFYERFHDFVIRNDFIPLLESLSSSNNTIHSNSSSTAPDETELKLLAMIDQPTPQNARELYNILHDLNYSFKAVEEGKKNKELFGLSYDTFNAWLADPKSTRYRNPKLQTWQSFIYETIAKKRGFNDFNAMVLSNVFNCETKTEENT
ncbi:TPA: DNA mismatch repair protein, partial [Acinetobacter baumannii]|nr:DNA mismatch repair protein [Acinetobacter baumannii]